MTLIALLSPGSHPFLLGDVLIATEARFQPQNSIVLPVAGALGSIPPSRNPEYVASRLNQKVAVISKSIVVAYAGNLSAARAAMTDLRRAFARRRNYDATDVMRFLDAQTYPEIEQVSLIGIVRTPGQDRPSSFGWNAGRVDTERFGTVLYAGTGSDDLRTWLEDLSGHRPRQLYGRNSPSSFLEALSKALSVAYHIAGTEIFAGASNLSFLYGGFMEIASAIAGRVQKIGDIACMFWVYDMDDMILEWTGVIIKEEIRDGDLYVRRLDASKGEDSIHYISPLLGSGSKRKINWKKPSLNAKYCCHVMVGLKDGLASSTRFRLDVKGNNGASVISFRETEAGIQLKLNNEWGDSMRISGFKGMRFPNLNLQPL